MATNKRAALRDAESDGPRKKNRRMTESQLHRKRESDRAAQRQSRARTKDYISYLESLVKSLRTDDNDRVANLLRQLDDKEAEIQRLRNLMSSIGRLVDVSKSSAPGRDCSPKNIQPPQEDGLPSPVSSNDIARDMSPSDDLVRTSASTEDSIRNVDVTSHSDSVHQIQPPGAEASVDSGSDDESRFSNNIDHATPADEDITAQEPLTERSFSVRLTRSPFFGQSIPELGASIANNKRIDGRLWYLAGALLSKILTEPSDVPITSTFDEDIAIRAVFHGWDAAAERYSLDHGWQWLRELDERIYVSAAKSSRLMHLRNCRLVFLKQFNPHSDWDSLIPSFFQPRPSQELMSHDPMIEHFPWPAFRERLLFAPLRYATNKFMDALRMNLDFTWNLPAEDLYVEDQLSGLYRYSDLLNERLMDIRCYGMTQEFFNEFPELRADIPCTIISPYCLASVDLSRALREYIYAASGQHDTLEAAELVECDEETRS